jgi:hypothetical protein
MSIDVKFCLVTENSATQEVVVFQNLCANICHNLRSCAVSFELLVICVDLGIDFSEDLCGQSFAASVSQHFLGRSTSSDSV